MIKKIIGIFLFSIISLFSTANRLYATEVAGQSASLRKKDIKTTNRLKSENLFIKQMAINSLLKKWRSPMTVNTNDFIEACIKYDLDCYLLPAIAGVESTFGKHILASSHNPFGWNGGRQKFVNFNKAIQIVGYNLKNKYIDRGAKNTVMIGRKYSTSPTWSTKVEYFTRKFSDEEKRLNLYSQNLTVKF